MTATILIISGLGWILAFILFELVYQRVKSEYSIKASKGTCCRFWWLFLSVCALADGVGVLLFNLPFISTIGLSHCYLAEVKENVITLSDVLRNIPASLREAVVRIKPFLK